MSFQLSCQRPNTFSFTIYSSWVFSSQSPLSYSPIFAFFSLSWRRKCWSTRPPPLLIRCRRRRAYRRQTRHPPSPPLRHPPNRHPSIAPPSPPDDPNIFPLGLRRAQILNVAPISIHFTLQLFSLRTRVLRAEMELMYVCIFSSEVGLILHVVRPRRVCNTYIEESYLNQAVFLNHTTTINIYWLVIDNYAY